MNTASLNSIPPIIKPIVPDRDPMTGERFKAVGIFEPTQETIWLSHMPDQKAMIAGRVQALTSEGKPLFRKGGDGHEYPVWRLPVIWKEETFLLRPHPQGHVMKVRNFQPSEADTLREERRRRKEGFLDAFVDASIERGVDPDELLESILSGRATGALVQDPAFEDELAEVAAIEEVAAPADTVTVEEATAGYTDEQIKAMMTHQGFGKWLLPDGREIEGTEDAIAAQRAALAVQLESSGGGAEF